MSVKTESRALQLALLDLGTETKPTDDEIAESWGLADARSIRYIRDSEEYQAIVTDLHQYAISYAGEQVGEIVQTATEGLHQHLVQYIERIGELLQVPHNAPQDWAIPTARMTAATSALQFLLKLSTAMFSARPTEASGEVRIAMPAMVQATSQTETVRQYREMTITLKEREEDNEVIEAEYSHVP